MKIPTSAASALLAVCIAVPAFAQTPKKPGDIPVETFFRRPQYSEMTISPDGRKLAALTPLKGRNNLVVVDLDTRKSTIITDFEKVDAAAIFWVNDKRLCLRAIDGQVASGEPNYRGMYCINADGEDLRNFTTINGIGGRRGVVPITPVFDGSDDFIVGMRQRSRRSEDVYRFNTVTGRYRILTDDSPGDVERWVLDRNFVPRVAVSVPSEDRADKTKPRIATVWYRDNAQAKWEKLWEYGLLSEDDIYQPVAFDFDNETLYVATNKGRDKMAIYAYDTRSRKMGNLLLEHPMIDVSGGLIFSISRKKLVGVHVEADKPVTVWTDPDLKRIQRSIDATLPKTENNLGFNLDMTRFVVYSYSDVDPGGYSLYDDKKKTLEPIAKTREWLDPSLMAERKFITYKARDGMEIPAWITIPKGGGKNLPLVVNIHGGPWVRGYAWNPWLSRWPETQFFASRGYMVLEPEPRGSTGYGRKHWVSSFKQWGLTMQDDITDGALHLVKEGLVDKDRICLHGASYGGYATLEGLVKDPDLWKCGSAFVAVSDLGLLQNVVYSDTARASDYLQADFPRLVGDSDKDRALFDKVSPARNAARIKAPLLLAMGSNDVRVPQVHGDTMRRAMQAAGKRIEYVVYPGEAHGFNKDEHVFDHYHRVEKLFAEALK